MSGPSGRKKCTDAGLLKTVVDLLDAAEPVQVQLIDLYYKRSLLFHLKIQISNIKTKEIF